jgi:type I restriction enzyme S subunit
MIPEEWMVRSIGDVFFVEAGGDMDYSRSVIIQDERHPFPIYSNAITNRGLHGFSSYGDHPSGSITVTARGTLGAANYRDHDFTAIGRVLVLVPKISLDGRFFAEYLNNCVSFAVESTGVPQLTAPQISKYRVPVPPIDEQRAIAAALSDVDALISSLDKLIAKKRDIKQAAMQQLLTGRRRLPGFSGRWEERRLEDVAALDSENLGGDTPRDYEFNYVSLEDVNRGILRGYANQLFSSAPSRARRVIRSGDVLVSTVRPNLGSHLLFKSSSPDWICSTGFSVVRCVEDAACPGYVFYHLFGDYVTRQIDAQLTGSSYPAISSKDVGNLRMPFPSIDEQRAIASVLSDMDAEIEALERRRDKTWLLKQGMMQELLTGRVRLV